MNEFNTLFNFLSPERGVPFRVINDAVMGGVSRSEFCVDKDGAAIFRGLVSSENNGGFASVRANFHPLDISEANELCLRIKGDGKRYKIRLFNSHDLSAVAHEGVFTSEAGQILEVRIPLSDFKAKWRGRELQGATPLDKRSVSGLGLLISDKQYGPFSLQLDWIRVC